MLIFTLGNVRLFGCNYMHPILTPTAKKTCSYSNYESDHDNLGQSLLTSIIFNITC